MWAYNKASDSTIIVGGWDCQFIIINEVGCKEPCIFRMEIELKARIEKKEKGGKMYEVRRNQRSISPLVLFVQHEVQKSRDVVG